MELNQGAGETEQTKNSTNRYLSDLYDRGKNCLSLLWQDLKKEGRKARFWIEVLALIGLAIYTYFAYRQWTANEKAASAAQRSAETAHETLLAQGEMANASSGSHVKFKGLTLQYWKETKSIGAIVSVETLAHNPEYVALTGDLAFSPPPQHHNFREPDQRPHSPTDDRIFGYILPQQITVKSNSKNVYVWWDVQYRNYGFAPPPKFFCRYIPVAGLLEAANKSKENPYNYNSNGEECP
jgi:hypothetical protein